MEVDGVLIVKDAITDEGLPVSGLSLPNARGC